MRHTRAGWRGSAQPSVRAASGTGEKGGANVFGAIRSGIAGSASSGGRRVRRAAGFRGQDQFAGRGYLFQRARPQDAAEIPTAHNPRPDGPASDGRGTTPPRPPADRQENTPPSSELTTRSAGAQIVRVFDKIQKREGAVVARQHGALPRGLHHHRHAAGTVGKQHNSRCCVVPRLQCARQGQARPSPPPAINQPVARAHVQQHRITKGRAAVGHNNPGDMRELRVKSHLIQVQQFCKLRCSSCNAASRQARICCNSRRSCLVLLHDPGIGPEIIQQRRGLCDRGQSPNRREGTTASITAMRKRSTRGLSMRQDQKHRYQDNSKQADEDAS